MVLDNSFALLGLKVMKITSVPSPNLEIFVDHMRSRLDFQTKKPILDPERIIFGQKLENFVPNGIPNKVQSHEANVMTHSITVNFILI